MISQTLGVNSHIIEQYAKVLIEHYSSLTHSCILPATSPAMSSSRSSVPCLKCTANPKAGRHDRKSLECRLHVNEEKLPVADEVARLITECQELVDYNDDITQEDIWVDIFSCRTDYQTFLRVVCRLG